jgi:hypothetical protein
MDMKDSITIIVSFEALVVSMWTYLSSESSADTAVRAYKYAMLNSKAELFVTLRTDFLNQE